MGEAFGRNQAWDFVLPSVASFTLKSGSQIVADEQTGLN